MVEYVSVSDGIPLIAKCRNTKGLVVASLKKPLYAFGSLLQ
jgi:hypothetical protein